MKDLIDRQAAIEALNGIINRFEQILRDIRESKVDDSVCGMCEYDGAFVGQSGDWCNECPGFEKDDCFKLSDECRKRWVKSAIDGVKMTDEKRWSGLWSAPEDDDSVYGEKLMEGDTIYLLGIEGTVTQECGAWGWGSLEYVPWEELEGRIPHGNRPDFCYCDNFISFWELKWNFDDGYDWDGVPYIRHGKDGDEHEGSD